jgi:hypothetical protein
MVGAEFEEDMIPPEGVLEDVLTDEPVLRFRRPSSNHVRKVLRIEALFRGLARSLVVSGLPSVMDLRGIGMASAG